MKTGALVAIVERFYAQGIASEEKRTFEVVPDSEGEHAAQAFQTVLAPMGIGREEHFGVAVRAEGPMAGEFSPQIPVVDDRAVEN